MALEAIQLYAVFKSLDLLIFFLPLFTFENKRSDLGLL
jgi:hypothetical protein